MLILSIFTTDATCENRKCGRFYSFFGRNSAPLWEKGRCNVSGPGCSCEPVRDPEAMYKLARDEEDGTVFKMCFDPEVQTSLTPCGDETTPIKPYVYCGTTDSDCSGLGGYCGMGGVCCEMTAYIETPTCSIGEAYSKSCRDESDCEKERSYCYIEEGKSMGWCCQTETQSICPDTVTDHRREPRCDHSNISSCDNGICVHGRCCSTIKYDRATKLTTDIPRKSFYTNNPCSMSMLNKQPMVRAFCDPETRKYVILGTEMDFSEHKTELAFSNRTCKVNNAHAYLKISLYATHAIFYGDVRYFGCFLRFQL
ncbi:hypothetical protein CAEBREN_00964 [Caenorhabditis brenneri]|uniref:Domain of unknown function DX domain-containing protein n=1 Tax=Caenorhabditis brenneri TaxID=135651 RepID=G0NSJ1_CAEBE|nr:hypothetical protein CAEBREN_00964 [Caenorhabditis brenneri]